MTNNIILTGIPRAGTTLACFLLNKLPNVVALHEPIADWGEQQQPHALGKRVDHFFAESRATLLQTGTAVSKQVNGKVPDNPKGNYPVFTQLLNKLFGKPPKLRKSIVTRGLIHIDKPLREDFLLCVKHNGHFTTLLPQLQAQSYSCYAIIRHPLAILASWNSIDFAPYYGRMYAVERLNLALKQQLDAIDSRIERQIFLLNWFFSMYEERLSGENIIRYEEIVASRGTALSLITEGASLLNEPLENKNQNSLYDQTVVPLLAERLAQTDGVFWHYYSLDEVR